jgi:hypothetical protein
MLPLWESGFLETSQTTVVKFAISVSIFKIPIDLSAYFAKPDRKDAHAGKYN